MKRVFVTGGSGFLGRHLIEKLTERGIEVVAAVRSDAAAKTVERYGASSYRVGLDDIPTMTQAMADCDTVFHVAGHLSEWDAKKVFYNANVVGTRNVVQAARSAGIKKLVAAGASAVVMGKPLPMREIIENLPLQFPDWAPYIATKAEAEQIVREANSDDFATVVVRPPFIWGAGMPMLHELKNAVNAGRFALPDDGRQAMSAGHVSNVATCLILAAERGRGGEVYFVADDTTTTLKEFMTDLLATQGIAPVKRSVPFAIAWRMAALLEAIWRKFNLKSKPPITRQTLRLIGQDFTVNIDKARRELGYTSVVSRAEGLAAMSALSLS